MAKNKSAPMMVYLAGGFKSGWQDRVIQAVDARCFDPRTNPDDPQLYTAIDLGAIQFCTIVFAYLEQSNPYGYNLGLEIGYAHALGKRIVFVDEKQKGTAMLRVSSYGSYATLEEGIQRLRDLLSELENRDEQSISSGTGTTDQS